MNAAEQLSQLTGLDQPSLREVLIAVMQEECVAWTGSVDRDGYGRAKGSEPAHRFVYRTQVGPIPKGYDVDHLCFNRRCVNPAHLEAVTHAENMRRARKAHLRSACVNGHPYTEATTYHNPRTGTRLCRPCNAAAVRRYQQRRKGND